MKDIALLIFAIGMGILMASVGIALILDVLKGDK